MPKLLLPLVGIVLVGAMVASGGAHGAAQAQQGELTVTPNGGPVGTTVLLEGQGCNNPGQPTRFSFGQQIEEAGGGTVGAIDLPDIPTEPNGQFRTTFVIPGNLDPYQGEGGGSVIPGVYHFFSHPPLCITEFTLAPGGLPETGGEPADGGDSLARILIALGIGLIVAPLVAAAALLLALRPRGPIAGPKRYV